VRKVKTTFSAAGDMLIQRKISTDYEGFKEVSDYISKADVRFFNLETTLHHGEFFGNQFYGGSYLFADPSVLEIAKAYGFNMLSFANNHTMDYAHDGLLATLDAVNQAGFVNAGAGKNLDDAAEPGYLDTANGRVALVSAVSSMMNVAAMAGKQSRRIIGRPGVNGLRIDEKIELTAEEFEVINRIAEQSGVNAKDNISRAEGYQPALPEGVTVLKDLRFVKGDKTCYHTAPNKVDMERIKKAIYEAQMHADYIIVSIHAHEVGGTSKEEPAQFLKEFAHECIDSGAHAVIGHGPHLIRPLEIYKGYPIFYSLGDFMGDGIDEAAYSVLLDLQITKSAKTGKVKISGFDYVPIYRYWDGDSLQILRAREAVAAYECNAIGRVSEEAYLAMKAAMGDIQRRISAKVP